MPLRIATGASAEFSPSALKIATGVGTEDDIRLLYRADSPSTSEKLWAKGGLPEITSFTLAPTRFRSEDAKGAHRITARWAITGATTSRELVQDNKNGVRLTIPLANDATEHTGLTIPDADARYELHAVNANGEDVSFAEFMRTKDVAITAFTATSRGQSPQPGGVVLASWDLDWTVVGWPRPRLALTTNDHTRAPVPSAHTHYAGSQKDEVATGSARYTAQVVAGRAHSVDLVLTADNGLTNARRSIVLRTS